MICASLLGHKLDDGLGHYDSRPPRNNSCVLDTSDHILMAPPQSVKGLVRREKRLADCKEADLANGSRKIDHGGRQPRSQTLKRGVGWRFLWLVRLLNAHVSILSLNGEDAHYYWQRRST